MNNDGTAQMDKLGITCMTKSRYHFKNHKYDKLSDAVRFAKIDTELEISSQEPLIIEASNDS